MLGQMPAQSQSLNTSEPLGTVMVHITIAHLHPISTLLSTASSKNGGAAYCTQLLVNVRVPQAGSKGMYQLEVQRHLETSSTHASHLGMQVLLVSVTHVGCS
jgi:hypothetical protein